MQGTQTIIDALFLCEAENVAVSTSCQYCVCIHKASCTGR